MRAAAANAGKTYKFRVLDLNKVFGSEKNMNEIFKLAAGNVKGFEDEDIDVKNVKGIHYVVCGAHSHPTWYGKFLTSFEMLVALRAMGIDKVVSVPPQRISNHIKEHWVSLNSVLKKETIVKKLAKHVKGVDTNIAMGWDKIRAEYINKHSLHNVLNFVDTVCAGGVANNPKLRTLKSWIESVEKDVSQTKSNYQTRLAQYFDMESVSNNAFDLNRFYEDTKKHGDVRQIIEEVVPMLSFINIPNQYFWRDVKRDKAIVVKNLVDKLTK